MESEQPTKVTPVADTERGSDALPEQLGRYRVLGELGRGGMGRVLRALDPTLGRQVAIKLLSRRRSSVDPLLVLRREARAMARLQHPNVVEVFGVDADQGRVYIAMELVDGQHLGQWVGAGTRTPAEVLRHFVEAGRGLAGAHDAGVIHRDFKPSNVLIGQDGRVKVSDFGLARTWGSHPSQDTASMGPESAGSRDPDLTYTGTAVGTPTYMPPEQHRGEPADELSDQYAFCVALWYALAGESPFQGTKELEALLAAKEAGAPRLPSRVAVHRSVASALERGMAPSPLQRWASMEALLDALRPANKRTAWMPWAAATAAAIALPAWALASDTGAPPNACIPDDVAARWDDRRGEVSAALASIDTRTAQLALDRVNAYARRWKTARDEACGATDDPRAAKQRLCVEQRGAALLAWANAHQAAEDLQQDRILTSIAKLPEFDCTAPETAAHATHPDVMLAAAMLEAGRYEGALRNVDDLLADTELETHARAESTRLRGELLQHLGKSEQAIESLEAAFFEAHAADRHDIAFHAAVRLSFIHAEVYRRFETAKRWLDQARAMVRRSGDPASMLAFFENARGSFEDGQGNYGEAVEAFGHALELRDESGTNALVRGAPLNNRASARAALGDYAGAVEDSRLAVAAFEDALGPQHPYVLTALSNMTANLHQTGAYAEVLEVCDTLIARASERHGAAHESIASAEMARGLAHKRLGRPDEAEAAFIRGIEVRKALNDDGPSAALAWVNLAGLYLEQGKLEDAEPWMQRGRETLERTLGAQHPATAQVLGNMARLRHAQGRYTEAEGLLDTTLEALTSVLDESHPLLGSFYLYRAQARHEQGKNDQARQDYVRALPLLESGGPPEDVQECESGLATLNNL